MVDLSAQAERTIRECIIRGKFGFGEKLSDRALAATLGISRTPVREALASLAREGLVVIRPQSGTFVMVLDEASVRALCEMRTVLELGALRLLADHPERLAIAVSKQIATGALAVEAKDIEQAERMDSEFHQALVHAAENPLLTQAYQAISHKLDAIRHRLPPDLERMRRAVEQHRRIVDLTVTGRIDEANAELVAHLKIVQQLAVPIVGSEAQGTAASRRARGAA
ncbi:GntR family transcriptional regulator [Afipia sp. GAS231]|uniref:GntR family transcriptional regulator n=1 Tax=Afipia sp. GAS231 TaxID=1882747 RepID=UPI00087DAD7D|nr:GntR family transcriptional regulator [Afipia sp. GAS231]SDN41868.1 DNA-binding transcriptional regulator, GntR family [Afipia sp. GAS231]